MTLGGPGESLDRPQEARRIDEALDALDEAVARAEALQGYEWTNASTKKRIREAVGVVRAAVAGA